MSGTAAGTATSPIRYAYEEAASLAGGVTAQGQLTSVTWQDGTVRRYQYEDARFPTVLTGITDEAGVRYATYAYDGDRKLIREEHFGAADRLDFAYGANQSTVTDYSGPNGSATQRTYTFSNQGGVLRPTAVSAPCPLCGSTQQSTGYDADGNISKSVSHDGKATFYAYDAKGREVERATFAANHAGATTRPALSAAQSVITTAWHGTFNLPTQIAGPKRYQDFSYNATGDITLQGDTETLDETGAQKFGALRIVITRKSTLWVYNTSSLPTTIRQTTGGDANGVGALETGRWTLTYNAAGDVTRTTHVASGAASTVTTYDAHGRMLSGSDDSGAPVSFQYSPRGFVTGRARGAESLSFVQNAIGLTTEVRMPESQTLRYVYDANHKLTDVLLNGASITPAMLARSEFPDTPSKARVARARASFERVVGALIPPAHAQSAAQAGRGVVPVPGRPMPGQPEFDPRWDMMSMAPMSPFDKVARNIAEQFARSCECKPDGGYDRPTFTFVSFAHVLFSGHLSPRFSNKSYFASTEKAGQALVDEVMARGQVVPQPNERRVVVEADLIRPLNPVGYARTTTGAFVPTNKVRLVYERNNCSTRFHARNEVVTLHPI